MKEVDPFEGLLRVIGRKATLTLLSHLLDGPKRFTTLERLLGVSPRTLSERLKELELLSIIDRHVYPEVPPRVEYTLTAKGHALTPLIEAMRRWGEMMDEEETYEQPSLGAN